MKLDNIIILQNKIDLVTETDAVGQHKQIKQFVKGTVAESAPIVPISAQLEHNVDLVCHHIVKNIPVPVRRRVNYFLFILCTLVLKLVGVQCNDSIVLACAGAGFHFQTTSDRDTFFRREQAR